MLDPALVHDDDYAPTGLDRPPPIDRLTRLRAVMRALGPDCRLVEARNHLREDGETCSQAEFDAVKAELWPRGEDWHLPLTTMEEVCTT